MRRLSDIIYNQHPLTLRPSATVKEACRNMSEVHAGSVLITDENGRLSGIFTGRDAVCRVLAAGKDAAATKLADVMTAGPITMSPDSSAIDALRLMWDGGFSCHVPIIKNGRVAGVVSRGDFKGVEQDRLEEERSLVGTHAIALSLVNWDAHARRVSDLDQLARRPLGPNSGSQPAA